MLIPRERRNERPLAIYPPCSYSFILSCCSSMPTFVARLLFSLALLINACWVK
ncbi:hypothetical protein HBH56_085890 [Parastagonospora nodorum]|uniref:Uncharacterized protein n=1 Tax=Phaeosphaeria nodorum (strain SN15 / ATCC MYA-4574 / FGSC 10173) TaxID=321614 RepID=A0A7U2HYU2_PHANO|nr:hypothetical protein HBH56_085890 [Parastagonospora nodorum]QRC96930.1 hypothetical protein JI435_409800 [Parastagonospora nodorum SN15]KAH3929999.1 hypothetical protein HBH54_115950 [Parastagonospora nodorum]KAH3955646.1 hypothetical protein HBH53_008640 [Parastagonospora nodorum]KAH3982422.1 hypothetical protein HBH52_081600 [Parastagonospora nodorum]